MNQVPQAPAFVPSVNPSRLAYQIAADISREWKKVYFGAVPYLEALHALGDSGDSYGQDSGKSIAAYFLANASGFRGPRAKELKAELKALYGIK